MSDTRQPGSDEAVAAGCICPRMDNCRGKGRYGDGEKYGWWMVEGCPLHDAPPRDYSSNHKEPK